MLQETVEKPKKKRVLTEVVEPSAKGQKLITENTGK
jgi:hypothetical protein